MRNYIPEYVKDIFSWYLEDKISENELLQAIQHLIDTGVLRPGIKK